MAKPVSTGPTALASAGDKPNQLKTRTRSTLSDTDRVTDRCVAITAVLAPAPHSSAAAINPLTCQPLLSSDDPAASLAPSRQRQRHGRQCKQRQQQAGRKSTITLPKCLERRRHARASHGAVNPQLRQNDRHQGQ